MVAVKTELYDCCLVHMYVSPHMFISQKFEEFGSKKIQFDLNHNSLDFIVDTER